MTGDGGALLLHKEGVVCAVGGLVLGGQDELAAEKAIRVVVQRSQCAIAKTAKPGVAVSLVALDPLALQVQLGLGSHDCLDIIRFREGVHVHVVDLLAIELVRSHRISEYIFAHAQSPLEMKKPGSFRSQKPPGFPVL